MAGLRIMCLCFTGTLERVARPTWWITNVYWKVTWPTQSLYRILWTS